MAAWKRISIIYFSTAFIGALTYVTAVVILEGGIELGEPMWKGYLIQLVAISIYASILGIIFFLPLLLIVEKFVIKCDKKIASYFIATMSFLTGAYMLYSGANFFSSLSLSIVASLLLLVIQYLTMYSSTCFARDSA